MIHIPAPGCDAPSGHCITCSDEGIRMRVMEMYREPGLAGCVDAAGVCQAIDVTLVAPVVPGDVVLVHAGIALVRLEAAAA